MKMPLLAAAAIALVAFVGTPSTAEAGGLHHLCPTHWMKHVHHHHHAKKPVAVKKAVAVKKVASVKKVVKKPAKKAAAKPLK